MAMFSPVKKELILINPRLYYFFYNLLQSALVKDLVPYSLLTLAALTPREYKIKIINQKQFWFKKDFTGGSLVGITCLTSTVFEAYQLSDRFRRAGSRVVLGGPHVSALPQEALEHADSVVVGEAESVWGEVIQDFERGSMQKIYKGVPLEDFFTPVYEYFLRLDPRILRRSGVHIDRGCRYHCEFCARISQWCRSVKIEQVLELIKRMKIARGVLFNRNAEILRFQAGDECAPITPRSIGKISLREIFPISYEAGSSRKETTGFSPWRFNRKTAIRFSPDNIYSNPSYAKELFKKLIPLHIIYGANCTVDIGFDSEALQLAKASGCQFFLIGFESIHPETFKKTSPEQIRTIEDYRVAIKNIRAHGIKIIGSFIIGLDESTHLDYLKLLWFLIRTRLDSVLLSILTPFPGSALFDRLKKENRIFSFDWRNYFFFFFVFKPKRTSLFSAYVWCWLIRMVATLLMPQYYILLFVYTISFILVHAFVHHLRGF